VEKRKIRHNEKLTRLETLKTHLLLLILASGLAIFLPIALSVLLSVICVISGNETSCQISNSSETGGYMVEMMLKIWHFIQEIVK
jgi:hypothetical protein